MFRKAGFGSTLILLFVSMLTLSFNIQPAMTEPTTIVVPDDYSTIQGAINHASNGDTIFVKNGTYYENVVVNKTVSLIGEDKTATILDGGGTGAGILVAANQVTVEGFSVSNSESGITVESNGNIVSSNMVYSNGNNVSEVETGLEVHQDYVSPLSRWYLHNLINGSYTGFFNVTEFTTAIGVHAFGHADVNWLGIGLFYDENQDNTPQTSEIVGFVDAKEQNVESYLINPPEGRYIIKVIGWDVPGDLGHFDLKIVRYSGYGIGFFSSQNNTVSENVLMSNPVGLCLRNCYNTTVRLNNATGNVGGIAVGNSKECVISGNNATMNDYDGGSDVWGVGIALWSVCNSFISENYVSLNALGVYLWNSSRNMLIGNIMLSGGWGLGLQVSHENTVRYNNISFGGDGVRMMFASWNNITENCICSNGHAGMYIWLENDNNRIVRNRFYSNNQHGVELKFSDNNTIAENKVAFNGKNGVLIIESTGCTVNDNLVFSSPRGIMVYDSFGNTIYHNGIIDNWEQPSWDGTGGNLWDNGYPDGGNYWSDYEDADQYSGPYQNETGSDGIWDHPHGVEVNNEDNYPLIRPISLSLHDIGVTSLVTSKTVVAQGFSLYINVKVFNYGNNTETFNVTAYYNETVITSPYGENYTTITLTSENYTTATFMWNTTSTPKGNYIITTKATPLPEETDITDNTYIDGWIFVVHPGDLDCDGHVFLYDLTILGTAWDSRPDDQNWDAVADIDGDGHVFLYDLTILGSHWDEYG